MTRAQCIVVREKKLLMVQHRQDGVSYWCLPGGAVEEGEAPPEAALRELREECSVEGTLIRETSHLTYAEDDETYTYLVKIGDQVPRRGKDPELSEENQILIATAWLTLAEIPERDRTFLWAAGLLGIEPFFKEVVTWGSERSYPGLGTPAG
jgi:ADP-ribose pyrophosphatase YjhB (NUDIX family)